MPLFSQLGRDWFVEPLVALMALGSGGNAITLSRRLIDAGVRSAATLARVHPQRSARRGDGRSATSSAARCTITCCASGSRRAGSTRTSDVRLRVFPPNQMAGHMASGYLDGFCVGEPWNTLARAQRRGADRRRDDRHPARASGESAGGHAPLAAVEPRRCCVPMIRAVLRAAPTARTTRNHDALAELLARARYLNTPAELIDRA